MKFKIGDVIKFNKEVNTYQINEWIKDYKEGTLYIVIGESYLSNCFQIQHLDGTVPDLITPEGENSFAESFFDLVGKDKNVRVVEEWQ